MWLDPIQPRLRDRAVVALDAGDVVGFLVCADNVQSLDLVWRNFQALKKGELYEEALLAAFAATRVNNHGWPLDDLRRMFERADRERLRSVGEPLPGPGPFTLFRGVAGRGPARRVRGLSWTASMDQAAWFADRFASIHHDPAVFRVTVTEDNVYAYVNERNEQEFILSLPDTLRPVRVLDGEELAKVAARVRARKMKEEKK